MKEKTFPGKPELKSWLLFPAVLVPVGLYHALNVLDAARSTGDPLTLKLYVILFPLLLLIAGAAAFFLMRRNAPLHRVFFAAGLGLGILFLTVMPGLSAPDEPSHFITAYRLSSRMMGQPELTAAGLVAVRADDYLLEDLEEVKTPEITDDEEGAASVLGNPVQNATYRTIRDFSVRYPHREGMVSSALPDVRTTPVMYLPQAAGITLARILKLSPPALITLGRSANLLVFLFLTAAAIRVLPFGKEVLMAAGLLPMTLHLAASLSYDAGILGCTFLFTAMVLKILAEGMQSKRELVFLVLLTMAFSPCKLVYAPLAFLPFMIPAEQFGGRKQKIVTAAVLLFGMAAAMLLVNGAIIRSYADGSAVQAAAAAAESAETGGEAAAAVRGYAVSELIRRPVFIVRMVCNTFSQQSDDLVLGLLGTQLGNLDPVLGLPFFAAAAQGGILLLLMLKRPGEEKSLTIPMMLWSLLISAGIILLTAGAMLVAWTTQGAAVIEGIQGRYFLPVLPLILLCFRNDIIIMKRDISRGLLCSLILIDCYALLRIFTLAAMRI